MGNPQFDDRDHDSCNGRAETEEQHDSGHDKDGLQDDSFLVRSSKQYEGSIVDKETPRKQPQK